MAYANAFVAKNFYGYAEFNVANAPIMGDGNHKELFGTTILSTNVPMVPPGNIKTLDFEFPHKAYLSAGSDNWSLVWGRFNIGWGSGRTGNLIIGDHLGQHNAARIAVWIKDFKYTFLIDSFPHPMNYYSANGYEPYKSTQEKIRGLRFMMAHRLEWRTLGDRLGLALTEGLMYMSEDNTVDLSVLNPSLFWHNLYTREHSNSILGFEADFAVMKGLNVYASVAIDEFLLPGEPVPGKKGNGPAEPSAFGYILGATYEMPFKGGVFSFTAEGAYTDPFLYLRDGGGRNQEKGQYGINYVVALRRIYETGGRVKYDEEYLGYRFGGDSIVGYLEAQYNRRSEWGAKASLFFMAHGTFDQWTVWTRINPGDGHNYPEKEPKTPTTEHITDNQLDPDAKSRDSVEYTFDISLSGEWNFHKNLTARAAFDFVLVANPANLKANGVKTDVQLTLGIGYAL